MLLKSVQYFQKDLEDDCMEDE